MAENRTQQWREAKRQQGFKAVTVWLTADEELRLKDLALQWHCSPSELMQHALAQFHPGSPPRLGDASEEMSQRRSDDTDMTQLRAWLQAELPGMVRQTVEQLALGMLFERPHGSGDSDEELIEDSDVTGNEQRHNSNVSVEELIQHSDATDMAEPAYDATRYYLGKLCPRGHEWGTTGQSLLRRHNQSCRVCENEAKRARRKAKRGE